MDKRRVVVTGLGVVSPLGVGVSSFWSNLTNGVSGIGPITKFDASRFPTQIAGEVRSFDASAFIPRRDAVRTDRHIHYALAAAQEAVAHARLTIDETTNARVGVSVATTMGGIEFLTTAQDALGKEAASVSPYALPGFLPNMAAGWIAMRLGVHGPIASVSTACAAGSQAIGDAYRYIQRGDADAMLAGGADALVTPVFLACFSSLRALSRHNAEPTAASRPFDRDRDGFVIAEGSAILVLEELRSALRRGAAIHAELAGCGLAADAYHPTALSVGGPVRAMSLALADARVNPEDIDYVNAHGTSTAQNDLVETNAIKQMFGAHSKRLAVSANKSMTGHLIGTSGALEAVATVLTIKHSLIPPTINYQTPDEACDLDYVPNRARETRVRAAISNSFAFGGANSVLLFRNPVL